MTSGPSATVRFPSGDSLADVAARVAVDSALTPSRKRDLLSALNRIGELTVTSLAAIPARPSNIRELFSGKAVIASDISLKTRANIRASVTTAIRNYTPGPKHLMRRVPPSRVWQVLLDQIDADYRRQGLYRLACFCTLAGIPPGEVDNSTLVDLHDALVAEELVKEPREVLKVTIAAWNRASRDILNWPKHRLSSPFLKQPFMLPLSAFTAEFQADIERWRKLASEPDVFDQDAPDQPLRKTTIESYLNVIRLFASAMIEAKAVNIGQIKSLSDLLDSTRFVAALRVLLKRRLKERPRSLFNQANKLRNLGRRYCKANKEADENLALIVKKIRPIDPKGMSANIHRRVSLFDDPALKLRFLQLPELLVDNASRAKNAIRAAHKIESALLILLMRSGLRQSTIRQLTILENLRTAPGGRRFISVPPEKDKMGRSREIELNILICEVLDLYLKKYRPALPGAQGPFLFPGSTGGARSKNAVHDAISQAFKKHGIDLHPHGIRHVTAKIVVEADPGALLSISRVLGHSGIDTTLLQYLGTEGKAAAKHADAVIQGVLDRKSPIQKSKPLRKVQR